MGKKKPSGDVPPSSQPSMRGIAAYQKAMGKEPDGAKEGFIKTGQSAEKDEAFKKLTRKIKAKPEKSGELSSKYERAAKFMLLIGSDEASKILPRLDQSQIEAISKEIVHIKSISSEEADTILEEFRSLLSPSYGYSGSSSGGIEEARRLLYAAFGPEKGEIVLLKAVPEAAGNPFDFLSDFSGEQLALLFRNESPAACAMVFSRLPSKLSAEALANISPDKKLEIVKRIAYLGATSPEVIERVAGALKEKARHFGRDDAGVGEEIDGRGVLAAILKHTDVAFGGRLLEEMEENDPSLSKEMKDRLYTLEDVCGASDRPIQEKLRSMNDREIALLLRGRSDAFTQKILFNISEARSKRVKEEDEIMGQIPRIEAEAAAKEFLAWFRVNREEGRILMLSGEDTLV